MARDSSTEGLDATVHRLKDIARSAAERSAERYTEESRRRDQTERDHQKRLAIAVTALQSIVIPLLEHVQIAFESEGIPVEIIDNFDNKNAPQAHVGFECCGPFCSDSHGAVDLAVSDRAVFYHDGTSFHFGVAKSFSDQAGRRTCIEGDITQAVLAAIEEVAESFFRSVERRCRY